jgi:hypothetical protein
MFDTISKNISQDSCEWDKRIKAEEARGKFEEDNVSGEAIRRLPFVLPWNIKTIVSTIHDERMSI